jgi:DNA-binding NarL/FixJ family response regulator
MSTILIIDDHPAFRLIIKMQLKQLLGIEEVIEADNGQTAVEMARQFTPKLAILDLDIPRISGLDVIPRLKLVHPPIRVLVLSGHDPATFAPRAMRSGVHGFVGKSQEMKEIMRGVEAVLAGYTVFPAPITKKNACGGYPTRNSSFCRCWRKVCRIRLLATRCLSVTRLSVATRHASCKNSARNRWWNSSIWHGAAGSRRSSEASTVTR